LSDKLACELKGENLASEALRLADEKIKYDPNQTIHNSQYKIVKPIFSKNQFDLFSELFYKGVQQLKNWSPTKIESTGAVDVLDFFSGCGGMSLGFAAISKKSNFFNILGGIDINETALKSFSKNFKAKTLKKSIKEIYLEGDYQFIKDYFGLNKKRKKPLVIIGCAPCQGFSAHRKKNWHKEDDRNTLIGAFTDIAIAFEPDYIVMENVPEILGNKYWQHYQEAREILEKNGYIIKQTIYNSAGFLVPQARHRAVIIASKKDFSLPPEIVNENQYRTVKDAIFNLPKINPGELNKNDVYHRCVSHKKSTIETISKVPQNGGSRPKGVGPKCLDKVKGFYDVYGRLSWEKPSITITQYSRNPASGRFTHPVQNRGLTIREAARIQSFPDGFQIEGTLGDCFKQIGEAVPPLLSVAIATQISIELNLAESNPTTMK
jgi:DNA (cytosine-5)-methyltransferase 1